MPVLPRDMRGLVSELASLSQRLEAGGGPAKVEKQTQDGKFTARERIAGLIDPGSFFLEIGPPHRLRQIRRASSGSRRRHRSGVH